jgi:hypothetical protein
MSHMLVIENSGVSRQERDLVDPRRGNDNLIRRIAMKSGKLGRFDCDGGRERKKFEKR